MNLPATIDEFTQKAHEVSMGCKRGMSCRLHARTVTDIRQTLVAFMGEVLDAFEEQHFGDPLPAEERSWAEYEEKSK